MDLLVALSHLTGWLVTQSAFRNGAPVAIDSAWTLARDAGIVDVTQPSAADAEAAVAHAVTEGLLIVQGAHSGGWPQFNGAWLRLTPAGRVHGEAVNAATRAAAAQRAVVAAQQAAAAAEAATRGKLGFGAA